MSMDAITFVGQKIREELPTVSYESLPEVFPLGQMFEQTSLNVVNREVSGIGRAWTVIHLYEAGLAGSYKYAPPAGPTMTDIGKQVGVLDYANSDASLTPYPKGAEAPHAGSLKRQLTLHRGTGVFAIPVTWLQSDSLDATVLSQVARDVRAAAKLTTKLDAISFHAHRVTAASGYSVTVLGKVSTIAEVSTTNYVKITIDEAYGRIHNFHVGMQLDVVADSAGVLQDGTDTDGTDVRNYAASNVYVQLFVTDVDYLSRTVTVVGVNSSTGAVADYSSGDWGSGQSAAAGDWIVLAHCSRYVSGTRPMITWGVDDWTKASGQIMGGSTASEALDLDTYSQFKSMVKAISGPLTEETLRKYWKGFQESYLTSLDTILTTPGVIQEFLDQPNYNANARYTFDRTGKALNVKGGWDAVGFSFEGQNVTLVTGPYCLKNTLYGLKLGGGNYKMYVPPHVGGSDKRFGGDIQFLAPLTGSKSIFLPSRDAKGAFLDLIEAPYSRYCLICPIDVRGLKFTGVTESTLV